MQSLPGDFWRERTQRAQFFSDLSDAMSRSSSYARRFVA